MKVKRILTPGMISLICWGLFSIVHSPSFAMGTHRLEGVRIGEVAPDFTLVDPLGNTFSLSNYSGKVVLLHFWASWCHFCREEFPKMQRSYNKHKDKNFVILAVNVKQSKEHVIDFMEKYNLTFPTPMDEEAAIAYRYGVVGLPTNFIIDPNGVVRDKVVGWVTERFVDRILASLGKGGVLD